MPLKKAASTGKLRIGDQWNAITIIALSQNNPLKAIAEFVENGIDAHAKTITILRGRERGEHYLRITDDGDGIRRDEEGIPDFKYVATHICDSIKRQLKKEGLQGIQGEFGIGLLSFWTVGRQLRLSSAGRDDAVYWMTMEKGKSGYTIGHRKMLASPKGTDLLIQPLLPGIRQLSGEKIQRYLASELRDRIRKTQVQVKIIDHQARKEYKVEPRQFPGRLLHQLPGAKTPDGEIYLELYLNEPSPEHRVGLYRSGTRVLESLDKLDRFNQEPWTGGCLSGIVDAPFLALTPGTRDGVILDERFAAFSEALRPVESQLLVYIDELRQAEEEKASRQVLRAVQSALREALLLLPQEEYAWFEVQNATPGSGPDPEPRAPATVEAGLEEEPVPHLEGAGGQKQFFEFPGPLFRVRIAPASSIVPVNGSRRYRAAATDRSRKPVDQGLDYTWRIAEGEGSLDESSNQIVTFTASGTPGLTKLYVEVRQGESACEAEGLVTVTDEFFATPGNQSTPGKGMPSYTFQYAPGELWRSRYDKSTNVILINSGHRDYVFAAKNKARQLRYICRLFTKELVLDNFPGLSTEQLLERMVELSLFTEEHL